VDFLEDVVENQRILAEDKGLSIERAPWEEFLFLVRGDPFVLRTLAQNLVNNAIKYTRVGADRMRAGMPISDGRWPKG
jgi:signal transduction histidine kinase